MPISNIRPASYEVATRGVTPTDLTAAVAAEAAARAVDVDAEEAARIAADLLKAPLASPAFTGTPTAPTQAADDSTTKIATTAYVQGEIADRATTAALATEASDRAAADTALDGRLDTAETAITSLDGRLDTAETDIAAAGTDIAAEETRALAAEAALDGRLDTAETSISSLDGRMDAAESDITSAQAAISGETTARVADVNAEQTRALAAEADLSAAIEAEETARGAADDDLAADLSASRAIIDWDRPADNLEFFTRSIAGGDPGGFTPIGADLLVDTSEGQAVLLTDPADGEDSVILAVRHKF
jgi:predicted  nucleic acid-binding Zn-ribbon protein